MKSILANPALFDFTQGILRVSRVRQYFIDHYAKPNCNSSVLDIGCGTGELQPFFEGCDYLGVDIDEKYLARARQ